MRGWRLVTLSVGVALAVVAWAWAMEPAVAAGIANASTSDTGVNSDLESTEPALSADGHRVVFSSHATNLDPLDPDTTSDIYLKDLSTGDLVLISATTGNRRGRGRITKSNGDSVAPAISADGMRVAFQSAANNLLRADPFAGTDIYLRDLAAGTLRLVSTTDAGAKASGDSFSPTLSADGRFLAFTSSATDLDPRDPDPGMDVFVKDLSTGDVRLVSTGPAGPGDGQSFDATISRDGTVVVFTSLATNLGGDPDPDADVYAKDLTTGAVTLVSADAGGASGTGGSFHGVPSGDADVVAFTSVAADLDPADTDVYQDVYAKDLTSGELVLISASSSSAPEELTFAHAVSSDGALVGFSSNVATLHPSDPDILFDVYVRNLATGGLRLVSSAGGVKGNGDSFGLSFDAAAATVAFVSTATNLVPADDDGRADVYVAPF